jgi:hypothetical protein
MPGIGADDPGRDGYVGTAPSGVPDVDGLQRAVIDGIEKFHAAAHIGER